MKFAESKEDFIKRINKEFFLNGKGHCFMQSAAKAVSSSLEKRIGNRDVLFVCGGGISGGVGFCSAEFLRSKGFDVSALCLAENLSDECGEFRNAFQGDILQKIPKRRYFFIVDCLLGLDSAENLSEDEKTLIEFINSGAEFVVSLNVPSGLFKNGIASDICVRADLTLAIGSIKDEYYLADGKDNSGEIEQIDLVGGDQSTEIWEKSDVLSYFPKRKSHTNKGNFGSASIYAGNPLYSGAVFLAANACLKSGAGYTNIYAKEPFYSQAVGKLPAAVLRKFQNFDDLFFSDAVLVGCGAGVSRELYDAITEILQQYQGTLILDADALNALSIFGVEILKNKTCKVIITPHIKEFSRLVQKDVKEVLKNSLELTKKFAREYGVLVVLKNNGTIITDGNRQAINPTGSPALAKGGSGDVLSGFLLGTCARGVDLFEAACASCYLFGLSGELAAKDMGEYSPCALDVVSYLPKAILSILA